MKKPAPKQKPQLKMKAKRIVAKVSDQKARTGKRKSYTGA